MMKIAALAGAALIAVACSTKAELEPVDYVNPYIGNISHLLVPVYPTVSMPHSMLRVFPMRKQITDEYVAGLPLFVLSHRSVSPLSIGFPGLKLDYDCEHITPYSYESELAQSTIHMRFAPSRQSAVYELTFREEGPHKLSVNAAMGKMSADGSVVEGYQDMGRGKAYVHIEFDKTPSAAEQVSESSVELVFDAPALCVRYGVSFISEEQAAANLAREAASAGVDELMAAGRKAWNEALGRLEVSGGTEDELTVFYTSYYRTLERPVCLSEDGRYWSGEDCAVHEDGGVPYYTDDWLWDTYHAAHPLRTIVDPTMEHDVLASYLRMSDENEHGWLPCFPGTGGAGRAMNSCHTIVSFADALCKGIDLDYEKAYKAAAKSLKERTFAPFKGGVAGKTDAFLWEHGYMPALKVGEPETDPNFHSFEKRQPIPVTTGNSLDCWAVSKLARKAGDLEGEEYFRKHSFDYRNLFNPKTGFFHPKDSDGNFIEPFDYNFPGGMGAREYYDENNGWVYRWDVQHNIYDLISLIGGDEVFVSQLDSMFAEPLGMDKYDFYAKLPDHTGNVGQFSMGNEPSLHVPYLYNFAGAPWKTQKRVRQMLDTWFRNDYMGIPGDEDGGGLTSFVVFSSMGFFPVCPGKPEYSIGSPVFEDVKIHLPGGRTFEVKAAGASKDNKYIQSAKLNGKPWGEPTISHEDIVAGGVLELEMGPLPNKEWGVKSSISYDSYKGLAMAGYQGWFSCEGDGSPCTRGYFRENGSPIVDMLPEMLEYVRTYDAPATMPDGSPLQVYSAMDYSSVDLHFRWMKEYGLDGVFMQRFLPNINGTNERDFYLKVLDNAMSCAERYDRAICIMYDLSGGVEGKMASTLLADIDELNGKYGMFDHESRPSYLWHNGKPLVVVWGVGFKDRPAYYMDESQAIIDGLKERGYSIMLGVPTFWREGGEDVIDHERLISFIEQSDIIMPWYVGRFENGGFEDFKDIVPADVAWCKEHGIDFAPNCWPGFSWNNMHGYLVGDEVNRVGGKFLQDQVDSYLDAGAESLYFAMFDEVNEATALFKIAREVPAPRPGATFVPQEDGVPSDLYLSIMGDAARRLKKD